MIYEFYACLEAQNEDGYEQIKESLQAEEDIDWQELIEKEIFLWTTSYGELSISIEEGNVLSVTVRDDMDLYGYCCTYTLDSYGLVFCTMGALRDYIKDKKETFVNIPG